VIMPYVAIVAGMVIMAIFIYYSSLPEINTDNQDVNSKDATGSKTSIFQFPHLLLGVLTLFLYVGVEVLAGDSVGNYANSVGVSLATSKYFATCTLSGMLAGYLVGIICIPKYFSQRTALKVSAIVGLIFSLVVLFTHGTISVFFVAFLGIANALMWPALWPLAINGLGKFTKTGSSLLIMGIAGGGLIPLLYGFLADKFTLHQAYWVMVPCYLFIFYYAASGYKKGLSK
jgi:FHS family L-fucose permease-like MFS transporter